MELYGGKYVRLESLNYRNHFLRHRNYEVWLDENKSNEDQNQFLADS
jgi:hypothetical protein